MVCRALNLSSTPNHSLNSLATELDETYKAVAKRLPENTKVSIDIGGSKAHLNLTPIDKTLEPQSLLDLRKRMAKMMPRVDLPELILEVSARTNFTSAFTHISERSSRAKDINISLCSVIMSEACNTGFEPLIKPNVTALKRDRLSWVAQNYVRDGTITDSNAILVSEHTNIPLSSSWGDGEIASADGMRFVVPVKTVHAGPNPKYFGYGKGVTWYNLLSNQLTGLNDLPVPGTMRDSMSLLAVVLEQQTELRPTTIMTDTGAYSDVVFGLFRLLGYRFSPRLADIGETRFWRLDPLADYGELNAISTHVARLDKMEPHWEDMLRLVGSLRLGRLSALDIMKTLQVGNKPTRLALAIAEYGRIDKTIHLLTYIDDEDKRHEIQKQLNRVEGRHNLAREIFHGKRGELRKHYREGQEDQLGALGLMLNIIVYWNTLYMQAVLEQLKSEGYPVKEDDVVRLSPLIFSHINMLGRYQFSVPDEVSQGLLRPLRDPDENSGGAQRGFPFR
jgi:TnpA family transposase